MKLRKFSGILAATIILTACNGESKTEEKSEDNKASRADLALHKEATSFFQTLPEPKPFGSAITQLGKKLYYENALSVNGKLSCNSCHLLDNFGVDNEPTSPGHNDIRGERNSPTVYNAYFHIAQFWDGRAADLKEQAAGPVLNPVEMGMPDSNAAVSSIKKIKDYVKYFKIAFPKEENPITYDNITEAIGEFEKTLATPAPFDDYLEGDLTALNDNQKKGLSLFIEKGCITCHMGGGLGGSMYQKFGLVKGPYWEYTGSELQDKGRESFTGNEADRYFFKVPSLRNVAKTAPYFHDGSVEDLGEAIKIMSVTQLGKELTNEEVNSIKAFLKSLTGEIPEHALLAENS